MKGLKLSHAKSYAVGFLIDCLTTQILRCIHDIMHSEGQELDLCRQKLTRGSL